MIKIYIASPYTKGDIAVNVKRQLDCFAELMDLGFAPFAPLYSHFQHMAHPRPYEKWLELDMEWVKVCDCLLRLKGESSGADREVEYAKELGIDVFYSVEELLKKHKRTTCPKCSEEVYYNNINGIMLCSTCDYKEDVGRS